MNGMLQMFIVISLLDSPFSQTYYHVQFQEDRTVFSFICPVKLYNEEFANAKIGYTDFELPNNLYAIAIDDCKIQRKLLDRFFQYGGIPKDRIRILGGTADEITNFCEFAMSFVDEHPDDHILFVVDENLDVHEEELVGSKNYTVSGSAAVAEMRRRLLPDQERRILTLIRSANDSASDVSIYNSRAHGYLPKVPVKKDMVLEVLAPLWLTRFPRFNEPKTPQKGYDDTKVHDITISIDDLMAE